MRGWRLILSLLLGLGGWAGIVYLVTAYPPDPLPQAIFYPLFFVAVSGTAAPLMAVMHRLFPALAGTHRTHTVALRQGAWIGLFLTGILGLRAARLRDLMLVVILGTVLVLLEAFWQQRR
ncbi:MAG: hypothetical protein RML36_14340 [Anaerolineae bacterium]|nr:hypothetical protein [Anaerolineae bacterium]MDW8100652.1 hypothetical protein [Anaerolineae bacterium]